MSSGVSDELFVQVAPAFSIACDENLQRQAVRARLQLGIGDRLREDLAEAPGPQLSAQVAAGCFPTDLIECVGRRGIHWNSDIDRVVHADLLGGAYGASGLESTGEVVLSSTLRSRRCTGCS